MHDFKLKSSGTCPLSYINTGLFCCILNGRTFITHFRLTAFDEVPVIKVNNLLPKGNELCRC